jgi:hypothetical protein
MERFILDKLLKRDIEAMQTPLSNILNAYERSKNPEMPEVTLIKEIGEPKTIASAVLSL